MHVQALFNALKYVLSVAKARHGRCCSYRRRIALSESIVEPLERRCLLATLAVTGCAVTEGDTGSQNAVVSVNLSARHKKTVTVNYRTADGTALSGSDFTAVSGKLTFLRGERSKSIFIPLKGDRVFEPNEQFSIKLWAATRAKIANSQVFVTILNDDLRLPAISISDAWASESNDNSGYGITSMAFIVNLSGASSKTVAVKFATQDGDGAWPAAYAGEDYQAASGTLTFAPGETTKTISITILGRPDTEFNETFNVLLFNASSNSLISDHLGLGWISGDWGNFEGSDPNTTY